MQRRHFLRTMSGLALSTGLSGCVETPIRDGENLLADRTTSVSTHGRLVVVLLRGALDGLSVLIPYQESNYYRWRPNIAIAPPGQNQGGLPLTPQFALHPALTKLLPWWQNGELAFIPAAGSPDPSRSHFEAQDFLETGAPEQKNLREGWLTRALALATASNGSPMMAISVGETVPLLLQGSAHVAVLPSGRGVGPALQVERAGMEALFDRLYQGNSPLAQAYREGRTQRQMIQANLIREEQGANANATSSRGFAVDAAHLGTLLRRNNQLRCGVLQVGGWDTHANQGGAQGELATRLAALAEGLWALKQNLGAAYRFTTVVVMSEFGRTVRENGARGSDHGHGGLIWLLGGNVRGGQIAGQWPGLAESALYQGRDVAVTTDFRQVLMPLLGEQFTLSPPQLARVFPSMPAITPLTTLLKT